MTKSILFWLIAGLLLFALYGTFELVLKEWKLGGLCPKILGIPACYLVFFLFAGGLVSHLLGAKYNWLFYSFTGIVFSIALVGTAGELTGMTKCPRTSSGIPMCFISLALCTSLLVFKYGLGRLGL